ncbi:MAG: hypothetical protein Q7T18_06530 [Sedimentisphaerales bacterium]|nr:hypothetical protein [Sedimentisphaerales bacterium]
MANWYAHSGTCTIADAGWTDTQAAGGAAQTWPPAAGVTLNLNGQTGIVITGDITCDAIKSNNGDGATAGGGMTMGDLDITIRANLLGGTVNNNFIEMLNAQRVLTVYGSVTAVGGPVIYSAQNYSTVRVYDGAISEGVVTSGGMYGNGIYLTGTFSTIEIQRDAQGGSGGGHAAIKVTGASAHTISVGRDALGSSGSGGSAISIGVNCLAITLTIGRDVLYSGSVGGAATIWMVGGWFASGSSVGRNVINSGTNGGSCFNLTTKGGTSCLRIYGYVLGGQGGWSGNAGIAIDIIAGSTHPVNITVDGATTGGVTFPNMGYQMGAAFRVNNAQANILNLNTATAGGYKCPAVYLYSLARCAVNVVDVIASLTSPAIVMVEGPYCGDTGTNLITVTGSIQDSVNFTAIASASGAVKFVPTDATKFVDIQSTASALRFCRQLANLFVKKGTIHGNVIGTLLAGGAFGRFRRIFNK